MIGFNATNIGYKPSFGRLDITTKGPNTTGYLVRRYSDGSLFDFETDWGENLSLFYKGTYGTPITTVNAKETELKEELQTIDFEVLNQKLGLTGTQMELEGITEVIQTEETETPSTPATKTATAEEPGAGHTDLGTILDGWGADDIYTTTNDGQDDDDPYGIDRLFD